MTEKNKERRGIGAIEVGGLILNALVSSGRAMSLGDLARESGMPASKAHAYLVSFGKLGLVEQDAATGAYQLGPFALQMGLVSLQQMSPVKLAIPEITRLAATTDQTIALAVWGSHGPTVVYIAESSRPIHVNMHAGSVMSMLGTATGLVFSAFLPQALVDKVIAREVEDELVIGQAGVQLTSRDIASVLAEVRVQGLARAQGLPIPGINALSAPVFNHACTLSLVITATGPKGSFDTDWNGELAQALRASASSLSRQLGHMPKL
ncbi:IclR family transcriptional regulator [Undibacterium umbellatum]|uniref:IclR family transcriptional regulator n=1 Tax=Undibacterium umbellatum TaxID=2762300 RepID=A0ABR6ZCE5_9BURK|nr:IclR family transcriptional regulator [Undibacterium umbellatum]MBC3909417.1 IclR family transcriptional regulator [Undibacterium umbellatum]